MLPDIEPTPVLDGLSVLMLKSIGFKDVDTVAGQEELKNLIKRDSVLAFESDQSLFKELVLPFKVYEVPFNDSVTLRWSPVTPVRLGLRLMGGRMLLHHEQGIRLAAIYDWVPLDSFGTVIGLGFERVLKAFGNYDDLKAGLLSPVFIPPLWLGGVPYASGLKNLPVVYSESLELRQITFPYKQQSTELLNIPYNWMPAGGMNEVVAAYYVGFPVDGGKVNKLNLDEHGSRPAQVKVDAEGFTTLTGKVERSRLFSNPFTGESYWRLQMWVDLTPAEGGGVNYVTGMPNIYQTIFECIVPHNGDMYMVATNKDVFLEISGLVFAGVFSPMGTTSDQLFEKTPVL